MSLIPSPDRPELPVVRSWPTSSRFHYLQDLGRLYVNDNLPKVICDLYDMAPLRQYRETGVVHLDWDVAVDVADLRTFVVRCCLQPERPRFADYRLAKPGRPWASDHVPYVTGCSYFPPWVLADYEAPTQDPRMTDCNLSAWAVREGWAGDIVKDTMTAVHLHQ